MAIVHDSIQCFQANNQKRIESCEILAHYCDKSELFLVLGQEPSTFGCGITGLNNRHNKIHAVLERPRAYIYMHRDITAWPLDHLCSQDVATALLDFKTEGQSKILLCSIYWDGRLESFPNEAIKAMKLANDKGYIFLLGGDANAQNTIYGSSSTDKRGRILEDILVANNLLTLNIGSVPTCTSGSSGSVIDVTAITSGLENMVENWKVSKLNSESDHTIITFTLTVPKIEKKKRTVMSEKQKESFTSAVDQKAMEILEQCDKEHTNVLALEKLTDIFTSGVLSI